MANKRENYLGMYSVAPMVNIVEEQPRLYGGQKRTPGLNPGEEKPVE
jgi:hypothetical protein